MKVEVTVDDDNIGKASTKSSTTTKKKDEALDENSDEQAGHLTMTRIQFALEIVRKSNCPGLRRRQQYGNSLNHMQVNY